MEIIAEIGQYHDGSQDRLFKLVENICNTRVDTIKLQHHIATAESSPDEEFRVKFSDVYETRFDYWRKMEISVDNLNKIKQYCEKRNKKFLCTPFSLQAVDDLEKIGVDRYKIGSADVSNTILLSYIASTGKRSIISNGLRDLNALKKAVDILSSNAPVSILHCTTSYPTPMHEVSWSEINTLMKAFPENDIGISDHTGEVWPAVFGLSNGFAIAELHIAYSKLDFGPDTMSSLTLEQLEVLLDAREAWVSVSAKMSDQRLQSLRSSAAVFSRSVKLRKDVRKGDEVQLHQMETFKPSGLGLSPDEASEKIGRSYSRGMLAGEILKCGDIL